MLSAFGGVQVKAPREWREATHLVCPVPLKRTPKFLAAVSVVEHVVTLDWLRQSEQMARAVDAADYVPRDKTAERNWRFDLRETLARTRNGEKCLAGYALLLDHRARRDPRAGLPTDDELKAIAECAGAQWLLNPTKAGRRSTGPWPPRRGVVLLGDPKIAVDRFIRDQIAPAAIAAHVDKETLWSAILSKDLPWAAGGDASDDGAAARRRSARGPRRRSRPRSRRRGARRRRHRRRRREGEEPAKGGAASSAQPLSTNRSTIGTPQSSSSENEEAPPARRRRPARRP